jgi:diketogulonate reductase-like aldo/keto reductase
MCKSFFYVVEGCAKKQKCPSFHIQMHRFVAALAAAAAASAGAASAGAASAGAASVPSVTLLNAAQQNVLMPITGFGTGGYTGNASQPYGEYPECFNGCYDPVCVAPDPSNFSSCGPYVNAAVASWLQLGGRRIDNSASYHNQRYVGIAMGASGIPRSELFLTSKVGPYLAMGYNETLQQFSTIVSMPGVGSYVDLLLVHWPSCSTGGGCTGSTAESTDPPCMWGQPTYDETACRISTWRAMVKIFNDGGARAIGVSNYNQTHLEEIEAAGLPLPAVNQCPFSLYHSAVQMDLLSYCKSKNILFNGYSPFGVPDRRTYAPPMSPTELEDPVALQVAAAHNRTVGEVLLAWQWSMGIVVNPRSQNAAHMLGNLAFSDIQLTQAEVQALAGRPQDSS